MSTSALWKFQYIRLPSNSFAVCAMDFLLSNTTAATGDRTWVPRYSRRMLKTFSVNPTAPRTTALCSAFNHLLYKKKKESCVSDERNTADW